MCNGTMSLETRRKSSDFIIAIAALILMIFFPIGTLLGLFIVFAAFFFNKEKAWVCDNCGMSHGLNS